MAVAGRSQLGGPMETGNPYRWGFRYAFTELVPLPARSDIRTHLGLDRLAHGGCPRASVKVVPPAGACRPDSEPAARPEKSSRAP